MQTVPILHLSNSFKQMGLNITASCYGSKGHPLIKKNIQTTNFFSRILIRHGNDILRGNFTRPFPLSGKLESVASLIKCISGHETHCEYWWEKRGRSNSSTPKLELGLLRGKSTVCWMNIPNHMLRACTYLNHQQIIRTFLGPFPCSCWLNNISLHN